MNNDEERWAQITCEDSSLPPLAASVEELQITLAETTEGETSFTKTKVFSKRSKLEFGTSLMLPIALLILPVLVLAFWMSQPF